MAKVKKQLGGILGEMTSHKNAASLKRTQNRLLVASKIYNALQEKGITQKEFAKIVNEPEPIVSDWLSGDRGIPTHILADILEYLNINLINKQNDYGETSIKSKTDAAPQGTGGVTWRSTTCIPCRTY